MTQTNVAKINLLDGAFYADDPWPIYRWLRDEHPVYRDDVNGIWGISRYADVVENEKHPTRYSSASGSRPRVDPQNSMIDSDDPAHQSRRRMVARRFTPRAVNGDAEERYAIGLAQFIRCSGCDQWSFCNSSGPGWCAVSGCDLSGGGIEGNALNAELFFRAAGNSTQWKRPA